MISLLSFRSLARFITSNQRVTCSCNGFGIRLFNAQELRHRGVRHRADLEKSDDRVRRPLEMRERCVGGCDLDAAAMKGGDDHLVAPGPVSMAVTDDIRWRLLPRASFVCSSRELQARRWPGRPALGHGNLEG